MILTWHRAQIFICALSLCYGIYFRNYSCELIYYFTYHYISVYINITALTIQYHRGKSPKFLECESSENQEYGRTFYEQVAMDLGYKQRFMHSFQCVYMLKDYPYFKKKDFEYLRGRIQVLIPDNDIFKKEDQQILEELFTGLDADIIHVPGGHVGMIVQAEDYLEKYIDRFLERIISK